MGQCSSDRHITLWDLFATGSFNPMLMVAWVLANHQKCGLHNSELVRNTPII